MNTRKHITLTVNTKVGGKPVDSNKIEEWCKFMFPIKIKGIVRGWYKN